MNKLFLITILFLFAGCGTIANQKANWDACMADPDCKKQAEEAFKNGQLGGGLLGAMASPAGAGAGAAAGGGLAYLIAALVSGARLRKKKNGKDS